MRKPLSPILFALLALVACSSQEGAPSPPADTNGADTVAAVCIGDGDCPAFFEGHGLLLTDCHRAVCDSGRCVVVAEGAPCGDYRLELDDGGDFLLLTARHGAAREGLATGDFGQPALAYPDIVLPASHAHTLSFLVSPMFPPVRYSVPSNGPLIVYDEGFDTLVLSPLDSFFASLVQREGDRLRWGLSGDVDRTPEGFTHRFLLVRGQGLNATVQRWGALLRADRGRTPVDRYADRGLSHLGFWTDNGGFYYYETAPDMNEEETMLAVAADAVARDIPLGYLQLDSWWYFKEPGAGIVPPGGLLRWEPLPEMFPEGLAAFQRRLGLPLILHNRWLSLDNEYRDRFDFVDSEEMALPLGRGLFDEFMTNARNWGAITYEQDWLATMYLGSPHLREAPGQGEAWMGNLHDAAVDKGLTVQICMAAPANLLDAVDRPGVTTVRTSVDYIASFSKESFYPQFHTNNMLAWAVGIWPFKDNFQCAEDHPEAEALMSALSAGMVGPSDEIGALDRELLLRTCREDGLLLKPDRPVTAVDAMFLPHARPYTTSTWSEREGLGRWHYVAAYHIAAEHRQREAFDRVFAAATYDVIPVEDTFHFPTEVTDWYVDLAADLGIEGEVLVYDWRRGEARVARGRLPLTPFEDLYDHTYLVLAPVFPNGLALIGEVDKFVTLADRRFLEIAPTEEGIDLVLAGVPGERVTLRAYDTLASALLPPVALTIGPEGTASLILTRP